MILPAARETTAIPYHHRGVWILRSRTDGRWQCLESRAAHHPHGNLEDVDVGQRLSACSRRKCAPSEPGKLAIYRCHHQKLLTTCPEDEIKDIEALRTVAGRPGKIVCMEYYCSLNDRPSLCAGLRWYIGGVRWLSVVIDCHFDRQIFRSAILAIKQEVSPGWNNETFALLSDLVPHLAALLSGKPLTVRFLVGFYTQGPGPPPSRSIPSPSLLTSLATGGCEGCCAFRFLLGAGRSATTGPAQQDRCGIWFPRSGGWRSHSTQ